MKHKKRNAGRLRLAVCLGTLLGAVSVRSIPAAAAGSVEDVLRAMRAVGFPENVVQNARIQYEAMEHDENGVTLPRADGREQYVTYEDLAMYVEVFQQDYIYEFIGGEMGIPAEELKEAYSTLPAADPAATESETRTFTPSVEPEKPFAAMSMDEKRAYIQSLPEEERAKFLVTLTPTEIRSLYRDADTEQKASLVEGIANIGGDLGMNVSVDKLESDGVSVSIRSGDGVLIDNTSLGGASVDDTGWDLRLPIFGSAGAVLLALGGLATVAANEGKARKREDAQHG